MKKLLTLILAILLALNIFACGGDEGVEAPPSTGIDCAPEADDTTSTENWEEAAKNGVAAVYITINPEIELILDEENHVVAVEGLNDDGKELTKELNILGTSCAEGVEGVLLLAVQKGYITQGTTVSVELEGLQGELPQETEEVLSYNIGVVYDAVMSDSGISFDLNIKGASNEEGGQGTGTEGGDTNQIVTETLTTEDGAIVTITYQNGVKISEVHESTLDDGRQRTSTSSYENGLLVEEVIRYSDGMLETYRYTNEVKTFYSYEFADGTYDKRMYSESGLLIYKESYVAAWNEFTTVTYTIGSNGLYTYSIHQCNDGYVEEVFYDANGNKASWKSVHTDGSKHEGIFDADGKYIEQ